MVLLIDIGFDSNAIFWYLYLFMFMVCLKALELFDLMLSFVDFSILFFDDSAYRKLLALVSL